MSGVQRRKAKSKGLHLTVRKPGDKIIIEHFEDTLEIVWQGKNGKDRFVLSFVGSKDFKVQREQLDNTQPYNHKVKG